MRLSVTLLLGILACAAWAQTFDWAEGGAPIVQGWNIEWWGRSAVTTDNGVVYVWSDTHTGERRVYAHKVLPDGSTPWGEPVAVSDNDGIQNEPLVNASEDGGVIVVWGNFYEDMYFDGIRAQKLNANGERLWSDAGLSLTDENVYAWRVALVSDGEGGCWFLWLTCNGYDLTCNQATADGDLVYGAEGQLLVDHASFFCPGGVCSDGQGGFTFMYTKCNTPGDYDLIVEHLGDTPWEQVIHSSDTNLWDFHGLIARTPDEGYIVSWKDYRFDSNDIFATKLDASGQPVWADDAIICVGDTEKQDTKLAVNDAGESFIVWDDGRYSEYDIFIQKLSVDGQPQWTDNGVCLVDEDDYQNYPSILCDDSGGAYVAWMDGRSGGHPYEDIYWQHVLSDGSVAWEMNGVVVCDVDGEQFCPVIHRLDEELVVSWAGLHPASADYDFLYGVDISRQSYTPDGQELLPHNGETVVYGETVRIDDFSVCRNGDATYVFYVLAGAECQLRAQKVLADGSLAWGEYGVLLLTSSHSMSGLQAIAHHDGGAAFVVHKLVDGAARVIAGAVDADGAMLWGEEGVAVSSAELNQEQPRIERWDDQYVVAWSQIVQDGVNYYYQLYAQKIVDGVVCWGDEGVMAMQNDEHDLFSCDVLDHFILACSSTDIYVTRIEDDGSPSPGLDTPVIFDEETMLRNPCAALHDDNLAVVWERRDAYGDTGINGQLISPTGALLWAEPCVEFVEPGDAYSEQIVVVSDRFYLVWLEYSDDVDHLYASAYDWTAQPVWEESPIELAESSAIQRPFSVATEYGVTTISSNYANHFTDVCMQHVSPAGEMCWDTGGVNVAAAYNDQEHLQAVTTSDGYLEMYWLDYRAAQSTETSAIFGQRLNIALNPADDEPVPAPVLSLAQNTPNPFNPETTISFTLAESGRATLTVYNIRGQKVRTLADDDFSAGSHSLVWDGRDDNDAPVGTGVYLYRLSSHDHLATRRMLLLK